MYQVRWGSLLSLLIAAFPLAEGSPAGSAPATPKQAPPSLAAPFDATKKDGQWAVSGDAVVGNDVITLVSAPSQQGAVWMNTPLEIDEWTVETRIHAFAELGKDAPSAGRSGFALWVSSSPLPLGSVHGGSDKWDGLAVMIDSLGPNGVGEVRGHLNDGTYRFEASANPGEDALSLCRVPYRDAVGPVTVRIGYGEGLFAVDVNGQRCFISDEVVLESPAYVGITADSSTSTDKLVMERLDVTPGIASAMVAYFPETKKQSEKSPEKTSGQAPTTPKTDNDAVKYEISSDLDPEAVTKPVLAAIEALADRIDRLPGSGSQRSAGYSKDLETRLQQVSDHLVRIESVLTQMGDVVSKLPAAAAAAANPGDNPALSKELESLRSQLGAMSSSVDEHHAALPGKFADTLSKTRSEGPSLAVFLLLMVIVQVGVFAVWQIWERRRSRHQKLL